jgi:ATP-dependent helicase/nuclease subunit A
MQKTQHSSALDVRTFKPESSVFVSANAGAGKTSLLINRVLSLLLHGAIPSKILCLTFTNAASAEMIDRVHKELGNWLMADEKALEQSIHTLLGYKPTAELKAKARSLFTTVLEASDGLRIQTIHAFCQTLLRRFPIEAGISPHFSIIDNKTEKELLQEARLQLFTHAHHGDAELGAAIHTLAQTLSEQGFHTLLNEIVAQKTKFNALFSLPGGLQIALDKLYALSGNHTSLFELMNSHFQYTEAELSALRAAVSVLAQGEKTDIETSSLLSPWLEHAPQEKLLESYLRAFLTKTDKKPRKLFTKKTLTNKILIEALELEQVRALRFYEARTSFDIASHTRYVLRVAQELLALYEKLKRSRSAMDYDDLISVSNRMLRGENIIPWVLFKLDGGIDHVLVDEAQDTSPEQWMIVRALTQEFFAGKGSSKTDRSLFVVGDEKQSIYSFQGADVAALEKMQVYFRQKIQDAEMAAYNVALEHSFRSTPEVLQAVDAIFAQPTAKAGLMFKDAALTHIPIRVQHRGLTELWPLFTSQKGSELHPSTQLARHIADKIGGWLENGTVLESRKSAIEAGDIMILVRSRTDFVDRLVRALKHRNIPVAGIDRMLLGNNLAIQDLLALGQFLLLPDDDLTLAALLKSPLCNLSEEALFMLAWQRGKASLWQRLQEYSGNQNFTDVFKLLVALRAKVDYLSPFELFSYALDCCGARKRFIGRMGEEYADPIDEFLNQALLYERSHTASMQGFLHWVTAGSSEVKRDMEQARNAVRIMTVHGAKGLQAPIVILPDTTEPPKFRDTLLWHEELPLWSRGSKFDDMNTARLRQTQKELMFAEYRRLLYVALTRAEDQLYVGGATRYKTVNEQSWYHLVKEGITAVATTFTTPYGEGLRIGSPVMQMLSEPNSTGIKNTVNLSQRFAFLNKPLPAEPVPTRPLSPSKATVQEPALASPLTQEMLYLRGNLVHKLLQHLPATPKNKQHDVATHIASGFNTLTADMHQRCIQEVLSILEDKKFQFLFGPDSLAEVPIVGNIDIDGKPVTVSGQIDRLCIMQQEVWVVDYKSHVIPPTNIQAIPKAYLTQMRLYRALLEKIYPQKTVKAALLWTAGPSITLLDEAP